MWTVFQACALLDADPPSLVVEVVPGPALEIRADDPRPGLGTLTVTVGDGPARTVVPGTVDLALPVDGTWRIRVEATDRSVRRNRATAEVEVTVDRMPPTLALAPVHAAQGRAAAVWVKADEPLADGVVTFRDADHRLYPTGEGWRALVGIPIEADVGETPLLVVAHDRYGNEARATVAVTVAATEFTAGGFIRLTKAQVRDREDDEGKLRMRAERDAAYAYDQPEQRWSGAFLWPVEDPRITSPFGKYRRYSTGDRSHHTGLDLGARTGTPVASSAAGRVLVAGPQAIFGNVVIVHHGQGVSTSYNHLDSIAVVVGQEVGAGEVVGAVGETGQATGPHLHWGLVVGGIAVDPAQLTAERASPTAEQGSGILSTDFPESQ